MIGLQSNFQLVHPDYYKDYFDLSMYVSDVSKRNSSLQYSVTPIETRPCTMDDVNMQFYFSRMKIHEFKQNPEILSNFTCIDDPQNIKI